MSISRIQLIYLFAILSLIMLFSLIYGVYKLYNYQQINQQVQLLSQGEYVDSASLDLSSVEVLLAYAALQNKLGLFDEAVEIYSHAERLANQQQLTHIYYNLGNLYLTEAIVQAEKTAVDQAVAMADSAKSFYRSALTTEPNFWNAKFNFEAAQRLSRDLPLGAVTISEEEPESSTELWSAMPGFPVGLP
ncbi:MAG: MxaK protein [Methylophaga sp.]|nr:MAG: MxaK protein [Methylophaga sp.]